MTDLFLSSKGDQEQIEMGVLGLPQPHQDGKYTMYLMLCYVK